MRAIDADKLCVDLMERWDIADKQKEELVKQVMADIVTPIVVSQPTIEPERKHGEWTKEAHCPFCDFAPWYEKDIHTLSYCPNCGADLRAERRTDDKNK